MGLPLVDATGDASGGRECSAPEEPSRRSHYPTGITQICRFWKVAVPPLVLYFAVNVVLPGLKPVRTNDALAFWKSLPMRFNAVELSVGGAAVFAPLNANDM